MRTYRETFRAKEFTPLFTTGATQVAASTVSALALGTLVYAATRSPLLSALSMFGASFGQLIGAMALMSAADRLPPRAATIEIALALGLTTAVLAVPGLPTGAILVIVLFQGLLASIGGGVRYGLLSEVLPADGYLLGRSLLNMANGTAQILGFAAGGVLVATLSTRGTLLAGAALYLAAAVVARAGLSRRPARTAGRPSVAETWRVNVRLWSRASRRNVYLALWVPAGLIVGCESLFVPYAPQHAGLFFTVAALGMFFGDILTGRFVPARWRHRLGTLLCLLLAVPYLVFLVNPPMPVALAAVAIASVGYSAALPLQERLMTLIPDNLHGQALGLHSSGMLTLQGVGAALAGVLAQRTTPATAMAVMAASSVTVTLALARGLRPRERSPEPAEPPAPQRRWVVTRHAHPGRLRLTGSSRRGRRPIDEMFARLFR